MAYNLNTAGPQQEFGAVIPDGSFVWLVGIIKDGGATPPWADPVDRGLFRNSKDANSDAITLEWEYTVQFGRHKNRKLMFQYMTMDGGQRDDQGNSKGGIISKTHLRAMIESARGIRPDDESAAAMQARNIPNLRALNGIPFAARLSVEAGGNNPAGGVYQDKNRIALIITPDMPEYAAIRNGQEIPPQPSGIRRGATGGQGGGGNQAPANGAGWAASGPQGDMLHQPPQHQPAPPPPPAAPPAPPPASNGGWAQPAPTPAPAPAPAAAPAAGGWGGTGDGTAAPVAGAEAGPGWLSAPPT